jgi:hypothetical protein
VVANQLIRVDAGEEILVHPDGIQARILDNLVVLV